MAHKKITSLVSILAAGLVLLSCAFGDNADVVPSLFERDNQLIYVAGRYNQHACMWITNGSQTARIMLPELPGTTASYGTGIARADNGIVVIGACDIGGNFYPVLWINGIMYQLPGTTTSSYIYALAVYRNNIYAAFSNGGYGCLWVDGVLTTLPVPAGATGSSAMSVAVEKGHVIVGGSVTVGGQQPCVWIDGVCRVLSNAGISSVNYVAWDNGHWYASGAAAPSTAAWWFDGGAYTGLYTGGGTNRAWGIYLYEGTPYLCGQIEGITAVIWVAGQTRIMSQYTSAALGIRVYSDAMSGQTVLVTGYDMTTGISAATLWINGSPVTLDQYGVAGDTMGNAITPGPNFW